MIEVKHLQKRFGDLQVLKDVNATIRKGDVISIIGPSGTGKSTFLRCLNLLDQPSAGEIIIDGVDILDKRADVCKLRQKMGMVFQSFNLFHHLTVLENLTIGQTKLLKRNKIEAETRAIELLRAVGLADKANAYPDQLSGGQKQRVAIARCLSIDPEIILFDEPTSALDPTMVGEVLAVIRKLAKDGMTMAIVTHEMSFAHDVSTRIFYMDEGVIYEEGTPEQIFENPLKEKTRVFINRIRNLEIDILNKEFDLYAMQSKIEQFCQKHFFTKKRIYNIQLLFEEIMQLLPVNGGVDFALEYSEKNKETTLIFTQKNHPHPIMNNDKIDDISLLLIKGLTSSIEENTIGNDLKIIFKLKD